MTNYENIILDIQTNGVITPEEALKTANDILLDQFNAVDRNLGGAEVKEEKPKKAAKKETKEKKEDKKEDKKDKEEKKATKKEKK